MTAKKKKSIGLHGVVTVRDDGFTEPATGPYPAGPVRDSSCRGLDRPSSWKPYQLCVLQQDIFVRYTYTEGCHPPTVFIIVFAQVQYLTPS
jgi:hypothetical protein